jgi:hypothetical protein
VGNARVPDVASLHPGYDVFFGFGNCGAQGRHSTARLTTLFYEELGRLKGKPLTTTQKATVQKEIERKSSDSDNYDKTEDLFYSAGGIGSGRWGLRRR